MTIIGGAFCDPNSEFAVVCTKHRWAVPRYFFRTGTVATLEKKYSYRSAGTFTSQFLGGTRYFCKIFYNIKEKSAQLHLPQQSFKKFVFKILYCHPFKRGNSKILFHRKRYFEAETEWSFRVRRPLPNGFVFEMQFRV